jgi:DnaJ-class molecular chaperone
MIRLLLLGAIAAAAVKLAMYVSKRPVERKREPPPSTLGKRAYEVLGVEPGATEDELHRAYQQKIREYHPDRVATMGPELRALAEARTKEINAAYRELCAARGEG